MGYVQRNPFVPRPIWWKRYNGKGSIGKTVVYVVNNELGFIFNEITQTFVSRALASGKLKANGAFEYISIAETKDGEIAPTKAIRFNRHLYVYDPESNTLSDNDLVDEDLEVVVYNAGEVIYYERNTYVKQYKFDCQRDSDQEGSNYQPISGLLTNASHITIKSNNFSTNKDKPQDGDIVQFLGKFWFVEETTSTIRYTPKERLILHLALKAVNK